MIRKILCKDCALKSRSYFPDDQLPPGVNLEFKVGLSRDILTCDDCGLEIGIGRVAVAMTYWKMSNDRDCSLLDWWKEVITPTEDFDPEKIIHWLGGFVERGIKNAGS